MAHDPASERARRRLLGWVLVLTALTALAIAWAWTPLRELIAPDEWLDRIRALRGHPLTPLLVLAGFLIAGLLMLPVTPMVVIALGAFSPMLGFCYALLGVTMLALLGFAVGRRLGRRQLDRLAGSPVHRISQRLGDAGVLTVTATRMVPISHFTIISLVAGASHIRWRDFIAGTIIGMAPGIAALSLLFDRAASAARDPGTVQMAALVLASGGILAALVALRAWARRR